MQDATLKAIASKKCVAALTHLILSEGDETKTDKILDALGNHFKPKLNVVYERCKFNTCTQRQGEAVDGYVLHRDLASTCKFDALTEEIICDQLVCGCKDERAWSHFVRDPDLSLEKTIAMLRSSEHADEQLSSMGTGSSVPEDKSTVHAIRSKHHGKPPLTT